MGGSDSKDAFESSGGTSLQTSQLYDVLRGHSMTQQRQMELNDVKALSYQSARQADVAYQGLMRSQTAADPFRINDSSVKLAGTSIAAPNFQPTRTINATQDGRHTKTGNVLGAEGERGGYRGHQLGKWPVKWRQPTPGPYPERKREKLSSPPLTGHRTVLPSGNVTRQVRGRPNWYDPRHAGQFSSSSVFFNKDPAPTPWYNPGKEDSFQFTHSPKRPDLSQEDLYRLQTGRSFGELVGERQRLVDNKKKPLDPLTGLLGSGNSLDLPFYGGPSQPSMLTSPDPFAGFNKMTAGLDPKDLRFDTRHRRVLK